MGLVVPDGHFVLCLRRRCRCRCDLLEKLYSLGEILLVAAAALPNSVNEIQSIEAKAGMFPLRQSLERQKQNATTGTICTVGGKPVVEKALGLVKLIALKEAAQVTSSAQLLLMVYQPILQASLQSDGGSLALVS